jgi:sugar phosphate permease
VKERHVSLAMTAILGSIPFWGGAASAVICGWASDAWIQRGGSPTRVRKTHARPQDLCGVGYVALDGDGSGGSGEKPERVGCAALRGIHRFRDLCLQPLSHYADTAGPAAVGKWTGLQNTVGSLSGIVAPIATGYLVQRTGSFLWAFVSPAILALAGVCCYLFLVGRVAPVKWDLEGA